MPYSYVKLLQLTLQIDYSNFKSIGQKSSLKCREILLLPKALLKGLITLTYAANTW